MISNIFKWPIGIFFLGSLWSANEGHIEVGKLWISPSVANYGYMSVFEYPGGSKDFYIIEQSNFFSCSVGEDTVVLFGGTLGNELDYGWQTADGRFEQWIEQADGINKVHLSATSDFSNYSAGNLNIDVMTEIRAYNHPDYDDMIVINHTFTNTGSAPITDFYYGSHLPVDVGASGISYKDLDDYAKHDAESGLTYMYDDDGDNGLTPYFTGQILLGIDSGGGMDTASSWSTASYYQMVNPITGTADLLNKIKSGITLSSGSPGPWSIINSAGPYTIAPGAAILFSMAIVYGEGFSGIHNNVVSAKRVAAQNFIIPVVEQPPPVPEILKTNVSSRVIELIWSDVPANTPDFKTYRIYKSDISAIGPWGSPIADTTDTNFIDIGRSGFPLFYSITSIDQAGNESGLWGRANRTLEAVRPLGKAVTKIDEVLVVPNPYLGGADWETNDYESRIYFTRLPEECTIYIYSMMGDLVAKLLHNIPGDLTHDNSGWEDWDLLSLNRQEVVTGLYLFRVQATNGNETSGKFVIVKGQR